MPRSRDVEAQVRGAGQCHNLSLLHPLMMSCKSQLGIRDEGSRDAKVQFLLTKMETMIWVLTVRFD
jgi:hypothetical protein